MKVALVNLKGGVGKTTTAIHLARLLSEQGPTLLVDADPQASAWEWCRQAGPGLGFASDLRPVRQLDQIVPELMGRDGAAVAHLVVDTPPGHEALSLAALRAVDMVLVPITPSTVDAARFAPTLDLLGQADTAEHPLHYRVLLTKVRSQTRSARDLREALAPLDLPLLTAEVPLREWYGRAFGLVPSPEALEPYRAVLAELCQEED
jgi:chromosome partitioning protein